MNSSITDDKTRMTRLGRFGWKDAAERTGFAALTISVVVLICEVRAHTAAIIKAAVTARKESRVRASRHACFNILQYT